MRAETLTALLEAVAARRPDAPALAALGRPPLSYAATAAAARRIAEGLYRQGVGPGDRVAIWLPNRPEYLVLQFALARLGATAIHINTRFGPEEVAALLDRARPTAIATAWGFAPADFPALLAPLLPDTRAPLRFVIGLDAGGARAVGGLPVLPWQALDAMPERAADDAAADAACLTFTTSGTTAGPKLVLHRQCSIAAHAQDVALRFALHAPGSVTLGAMPFCGTFGLALAMASIAGGARLVCLDRFDAAQADALMRAQDITHLIGSDTMLFALLEAARNRPYPQRVATGFASFQLGAERIVDLGYELGMDCVGLYGSSEAQALFAFQNPADPVRRRLAGGIPASGAAEFRVRDTASGELAEQGELELRGPSLFAGYLGNEDATRAAFTADGFYRTGDLVRAAEGGGFDFETRLGDALRLGGFLVNPAEIEGFLKRQPGVAEAQVVGAQGGTRAIAYVQPEPGAVLDVAVLGAACREQLARFKQPAHIVAIDAMPVAESPNGTKIQRARLRAMAEALLAPPVEAADQTEAAP